MQRRYSDPKIAIVLVIDMWQPNRPQWSIIWTAALLMVLGWPPDNGRSLGVKVVNWIVDPAGSLPSMPPPLPMSLDDNGDAVAAHDAEEAEYYRLHQSSALTRWRLDLKEAGEPFDPSTERQLLFGVAVLSALGVWRLNTR
jgi:hypothetical protein